VSDGVAHRHLDALTSPELGRRGAEGAILAVPLGSTEQHGPHLPVTVDTDLAAALVAGLTERDGDVVAAPPIAFGASGEHAMFPGTLSIGQEALELLLVELGRSATETFRRVLVVSAHGGNHAPLGRAVARLAQESRDVRAWSPRWGGDAHAGRTETSLLLHLAPERVALDRAEAGDTRPLADLLPELRRAGVAAVSSNGVLGDPAGASAAEGERRFRAALADLAAFVAAWRATDGLP
jgi:mycofactocin precursor peptide peptidase